MPFAASREAAQAFPSWLSQWNQGLEPAINAADVGLRTTFMLYFVCKPGQFDRKRGVPLGRTAWSETFDLERALVQLYRFQSAYGNQIDPHHICTPEEWASDCCILLSRFSEALRVSCARVNRLRYNQSSMRSRILSLKRLVSENVTANDLGDNPAQPALSYRWTQWGARHASDVFRCVDVLLTAIQSELGESLAMHWSKTCPAASWELFSIKATNGLYDVKVTHRAIPEPCFDFSGLPVQKFITGIGRLGEKMARRLMGVTPIGEGWTGETTLYYELKNALAREDVLFHAQPGWLGNQHLDVFIPRIKVALEYQGVQHDQPVEFFGGEERFREQRRRDERKLSCCRDNGIALLHVREGYKLSEVLQDIVDAMAVDEPLHINREPARLTAAPKGQLLQDEVNEAMTILFAAEGRQWKPDVNRLLPPQVSEATPTDPPARKRPSRGKRKKFKFPLTEEDRLALVREWEEDRRRNR